MEDSGKSRSVEAAAGPQTRPRTAYKQDSESILDIRKEIATRKGENHAAGHNKGIRG